MFSSAGFVCGIYTGADEFSVVSLIFEIMSGVITKHEIGVRIQDTAERLRELGVKRLRLFGSFVRGSQRADSDVDLLIDLAPEHKTFDAFIELSELLDELLGRRVELVTRESLSPYIGPHILAEAEDVFVA